MKECLDPVQYFHLNQISCAETTLVAASYIHHLPQAGGDGTISPVLVALSSSLSCICQPFCHQFWLFLKSPRGFIRGTATSYRCSACFLPTPHSSAPFVLLLETLQSITCHFIVWVKATDKVDEAKRRHIYYHFCLPFLLGAFIPGVPVQPVLMRYPNTLVSDDHHNTKFMLAERRANILLAQRERTLNSTKYLFPSWWWRFGFYRSVLSTPQWSDVFAHQLRAIASKREEKQPRSAELAEDKTSQK